VDSPGRSSVRRLIFIHHLNQHPVGILGRDPYPPRFGNIPHIKDELIPVQGDPFLFNCLKGIFQPGGGEGNVM